MTKLSVKEWREIFTRINEDCAKDGFNQIPFSDTDYYADQIWNLSNEGDLTLTECQLLAEEL